MTKRAKDKIEASFGISSGHGKGGQLKNDSGKCKRNEDKHNGGDNNVNHNNFGNSVQKRGNSWMCYCKRNKCGWNNNHTYGFHPEWKSYPRTFCLTIDHNYWKLSGTAPNHGTSGGSSGGGGTQGINLASQQTSYIYELVQLHQGNSADSNFTAFLSKLSEFIDRLKWLGMA